MLPGRAMPSGGRFRWPVFTRPMLARSSARRASGVVAGSRPAGEPAGRAWSAADQVGDPLEFFLRVEVDDDLAAVPALDADEHGRAEARVEVLLELEDVGRLAAAGRRCLCAATQLNYYRAEFSRATTVLGARNLFRFNAFSSRDANLA